MRQRKLADPRPCLTCEKLFSPTLYSVKRGDGRFCSNSCARKNQNPGSGNPNWRGGRRHGSTGYISVLKSGSLGFEHRVIAERALGRPLEKRHPVHHHDEDKENNANTNLVICEDAAYHSLLHRRAKIVRRGGDPDRDKWCGTCRVLQPKTEFGANAAKYDGLQAQCKKCKHVQYLASVG